MIRQRVKELVSEDQGMLSDDWIEVLKAITRYRYIDIKQIPSSMQQFAKINQRYVDRIRDLSEAIKNNTIKLSKLNQVGIPQGTSMSASLANVYMIPFDHAMETLAKSFNGTYRRYSDDFVLIIPKKISQDSIQTIATDIKIFARRLARLELESKKTKILMYSKRDKKIEKLSENKELSPSVFDYLGFAFDGRQVMLRPKGMFKFSYKSKRLARKNAFEKHELVKGNTELYSSYQQDYHQLTEHIWT